MQELKQVILDEPTSSFDIAGFTDSDYSSSDFSDDDDSYDLLPDIDQRNINNPTKIAKYAETIFCIAIKESSSIDLNNFFKVQKELTSDNHETAVKWLFNIQGQYQMSSNTLFESVYYLNIILSRIPIPHDKLLLFSVTCIWVASKMEEKTALTINDMIYMCSNRYKYEDFINCESDILKALDFKLNFPTAKFFLRRLTDAIDADTYIIEVSNFFCELSLIPLEFINYDPYVIAMASICLGKIAMKEFCPIKRLLAYSHIDDIDIVKECAKILLYKARILMQNKDHFLYQKFTDEHLNKSILDMELDENVENNLMNLTI